MKWYLAGNNIVLLARKLPKNEDAVCIVLYKLGGQAAFSFSAHKEEDAMCAAGRYISQYLPHQVAVPPSATRAWRRGPYKRRRDEAVAKI